MLTKKPKQITKKQHYVPKVHLKKFANSKMQRVFDIEKNEILSAEKSVKSSCWDEHFYAMETGKEDEWGWIIENLFNYTETEYEKVREEFEKQVFCDGGIAPLLIWEIAFHMASLYARTPYARKKAERMGWIFKSTKEESSNFAHVRFIGMVEHIRNFFIGKPWIMYILPEDSEFKFVTSDTPVVELPPKPKRGERKVEKSFHPPGIPELTYHFALSPRIMIEMLNPLTHGNRKKRKLISNASEIRDFNANRLLAPEQQSTRLFAPNTKDFEVLQAFVNYIKE